MRTLREDAEWVVHLNVHVIAYLGHGSFLRVHDMARFVHDSPAAAAVASEAAADVDSVAVNVVLVSFVPTVLDPHSDLRSGLVPANEGFQAVAASGRVRLASERNGQRSKYGALS